MPASSSPSLDLDILQRVRSTDAGALASELLWLAASVEEAASFPLRAVELIVDAGLGNFVVLANQESGQWVLMESAGRRQALPLDLLGDALDRESDVAEGAWVVCPLERRAASGRLLALHVAEATVPDSTRIATAALAPVLGQALGSVDARATQHRRIRRLEAILEIASRWNQTHEMAPLLTQMAETAARLLGADRASIFLWDKPNNTLVGRPALGVENNELRVPDDAGVVGQVVQSGEPARVDEAQGQERISRDVDAKLGYETRTLLCVPLLGSNGELFGAFEVINKRDGNFTPEDQDGLIELASHAAVALENTQEREQLLSTRRQMSEEAAQGVRLIGESPAIAALRSTIARVADTDLAVLILGENGTGKEVVSQSIHYQGSRRDQPFIAVNCAAISETLLESELFGHEKGAFTGADEARAGKFELASGGTLFLDEIGDMSPGGQAKLLRVLEEKVVVRVGGAGPIHTDARVIAATNHNLVEMVREKTFREDLYFRLNVVTLDLPALRERRDDILLLAEHFLTDFTKKAGRPCPKISAEATARLQQHNWPGNIRELRNLMERLAYLFQGEVIEAADLAFILSPQDEAPAWVEADLPLSIATSRFQAEYIKGAVARAGNNMSKAAKQLGLHRSNLYRKIRQLDMTESSAEDEA